MLTTPDLDAESKRVNPNLYGGFADSLPVECFAEPSAFGSEDPGLMSTEEEPQLKKRKLSKTKENDEIDAKVEVLEVEESQGLGVAKESAKSQGKERFLGLRLPEMLYPKSAYEDSESTTSSVPERTVLKNILVRPLGWYLSSRKANSILGRNKRKRTISIKLR